MDSYKSRLRPDGTVFPPVTPDPPPTPGRAIIEVPDIVAKPVRDQPEHDEAGGDTGEAINAAPAHD